MKSFFIFLWMILMSANLAFAENDLIQKLDDHFRIYLIKPEKRSQGDRVTVNGNNAVIYYWRSLKVRKPDEVICDAYEWLLLGRTTFGKGVKEAFEDYPSLEKIDLSFYEIEFSTKKGTKIAEILPSKNIFEYLRIGVTRDSFLKKSFDRKEVKKMIDDKKCLEVGKNYIDSVMINGDYIKGKK